jgi:methylamine dehydrogenase accessory protein MauD
MWLMLSVVLLWAAVLALAFLLLGTLRALGLLRWRLEELEATTPTHRGRSGIKPGKKAPDFTLPGVAGAEVALSSFAGRTVLLVFTQAGCGPCRDIMPKLNRLEGRELQILVVNRGDMQTTRTWAAEVRARFPVVAEEGLGLARKYEVFATPFAFLIDEKGVVRSKGIVNHEQHIGFVLSARPEVEKNGHADPGATGPEAGAAAGPLSRPT